MCAVSMITDHYRDKWGAAPLPIYYPNSIGPAQRDVNFPSTTPPELAYKIISLDEWNEYQTLKRKAEEYDRVNSQPDCVKPDVEEWEKKIEEVLRKRGIIT